VSGDAAIDQQSSEVGITVKKKGYPNGLFSFTGVVVPSNILNEPSGKTNETIRIPVKRNFGRLGEIKVH